MRYSFTDEQTQFRDFVRKFMETNSPATEVRRLMETEQGYDSEVWDKLAGSLGLQGLHIPEAYGGQGFSAIELCIALEEMGRALYCSPYFGSSVLATEAILQAGSEEDKLKLLPDLANGKKIAALALAEPEGKWDASGISMTAKEENGQTRLNGSKSFVVDSHIADYLVVVARAPGSTGNTGIGFYIVENTAKGLDSRLLSTIDETRKLSLLQFSNVQATPLGSTGNAGEALERTLILAYVGLANEMIGCAQKLLESALDYVKLRVQFGRTIGSFQVTKHKCADLLLEIELAKSAAYYAAEAAAENTADLSSVASLAKAYSSDTFMRTATETIQMHGGIGFTWENDTHLYFKRAKSSEVFLGGPELHRDLLLKNLNK
ncbi:MAG: acyl-CoA/acyl-ACP dehydrogenase [Pseudomonadales bacterium]|nr:acyl-CoA/acyl-ACP dehydrogenase [Pseudomonadales bacterium]